MKKNIFSVIITALTVINVVLTAILFFVMVPTFTKTNNLLTMLRKQIASAVNLDLNVDGDSKGDENYSLKDLETVTVAFDSQQTLNLKIGSDGKTHYALLDGYSLSVYKDADDYKDVSDILTNNQAEITDIIRAVIQSHSSDDISEDVIKKEALEQIQQHLDSKAVKKVMLTNFMYQ